MSRYRSQNFIPEGAKVHNLDEFSSDDSDDDLFSEDDYKSYPSVSDESSEPPLPVRHFDDRYDILSREKYREDMRRHPPCGMLMHRRQQSSTVPLPYPHNHRFSAISSSTNDDDESRTTNEDEYNPMTQYSAIHKPILPPRRERLTMIQELSPIQPTLPVSPTRGFALPPPLSKEMREWRPKHTSSVINAPVFPSLPKTNPHHHQFASPRSRKSLNMYKYDDIIRREDNKRREMMISDKSSDSSLFGPKSPIRRRGFVSSSPIRGRISSTRPIRPEQFELPAPVAKAWGSKGIVFLRMEISRELLTIHVDKACYFSTDNYRRNRTTYVQLEMNHRSRGHQDGRKRSSHRSHSSGQRQKSRTIENTDEPHFNEYFKFHIFKENRKDSITISVFEREEFNSELRGRKQLGCFTFTVSKILEKAARVGCFEDDENNCPVEVHRDGFFILDPSKGQRKNLPMANIVRSKNYTLDGPSSTSSSSLNIHSPQKMLRSDWPPSSSSLLPARSSSAIPPLNHNEQHARPRPISYMEGLRYSEDMMPTFKMESFENSTGSSSIDYDFNRHRMTLPAITTSSSITSDDGPSCSSSGFNPSLLHPGGGECKASKSDESEKKPSRQEGGVRRAASFTYSPTGSLGKHNRRPQAVVGKEEEAAKKKLFGPLTKTFSYIRSKMDSAISTTSLYPTKDEVRLWETSFEALLNHKFGQMLFTQFLKKEFSSENIEFWTDCEEFKKMKDGKSGTTKKAHEIYREFVAEHSPKEVNLDSDTRAATKAAMESGCRTDTFTLAQGKIEQLMAKDSYRRFLKDKIYLDMLNNAEGKNDEPAGENGVAK